MLAFSFTTFALRLKRIAGMGAAAGMAGADWVKAVRATGCSQWTEGQGDWGLGQVQSAIGRRVTVTFENAGKVVIDTDVVALQITEVS